MSGPTLYLDLGSPYAYLAAERAQLFYGDDQLEDAAAALRP